MQRRIFRRVRTVGLALTTVALSVVPLAARPITVHAAGCAGMAWMDTTKTPDQRAQALLAVMTQADKISMTQAPAQYATIAWAHYGVAGYIPSPDTSLCIPDLVLNDAGQGVGDFMTGTTAFPAPISQAASWDPTAQQGFGAALGAQAFSKGVNVQLAPGIETDRNALNGRNWEYMSEDPFLSGQTAVAVTRGIQSQNVIATIKHYVANSQETNRTTDSSDVDERTLHEMYMPQYQAAIQQGGAGAVMCSYNRINSVYACENPDTLTVALRSEMGFPGFVMSDWGGTHSTAAAANAGLDLEMGSGTYFGATLGTAITNGQVSEATLDQMTLRKLRTMFAIGLFDNPVAQGAAAQSAAAAAPTDTPAQNTLAGQIAAEGMVLLKNQGGILPLPSPTKRIAVIGGPAVTPDALYTYNGGGSGHIPEAGWKANVVPPLTGMQTAAATRTDVVTFADGNGPQFADAVAAATAADVAVVFVYDQSSEGTDRPSLSLPPEGTFCTLACVQGSGYNQDALVSAVAAANPNTVVVVESGAPILMPWLNQVKGVVEAWYPGQDEGDAIASVLFGATNPSGHLPETFPASAADLPTTSTAQYPGVTQTGDAIGPHSTYSEGLNVGYRWYDDMGITPLFPFGYGLSYTTFSYSNYALSGASTPGGPASVSFDVTNTGKVAGQEVAQVYVGSPANNYVSEPLHQLRAYQKTGVLAPGATQHITLALDSTAVSYWDATSATWQPENGCHPVWVGGNSRDIELQGSGLDGSMARVVDCAAAVSTYAPPVNTPEVAATPALLVPAALVFGIVALRRRKRRVAATATAR